MTAASWLNFQYCANIIIQCSWLPFFVGMINFFSLNGGAVQYQGMEPNQSLNLKPTLIFVNPNQTQTLKIWFWWTRTEYKPQLLQSIESERELNR